jgi:hypothetical protein
VAQAQEGDAMTVNLTTELLADLRKKAESAHSTPGPAFALSQMSLTTDLILALLDKIRTMDEALRGLVVIRDGHWHFVDCEGAGPDCIMADCAAVHDALAEIAP